MEQLLEVDVHSLSAASVLASTLASPLPFSTSFCSTTGLVSSTCRNKCSVSSSLQHLSIQSYVPGHLPAVEILLTASYTRTNCRTSLKPVSNDRQIQSPPPRGRNGKQFDHPVSKPASKQVFKFNEQIN